MGIMEKTVGLVEVMSDIERTAFIEVLREKGLLVVPEAEAKEGKGKGGGGRRGRKGYWMKLITGWDDTKKGAWRAQGDFARASEMSDGTLLLMGWTAPDEEKRYAIVEVLSGCIEAIEVLHSGRKEVNGVVIRHEFKTWKDFESAAKGCGMGY